MRWLWFLIFLLLAAAIITFAVINRDRVAINYINYVDQTFSVQSIHVPMAALIAGVYVLGMLTGWTVVGFIRRTVRHVTERRPE